MLMVITAETSSHLKEGSRGRDQHARQAQSEILNSSFAVYIHSRGGFVEYLTDP